MSQNNLRYVLALLAAPNVGVQTIRKLVEHYGSAEAVFREQRNDLQNIPGIGQKLAETFFDEQLLAIADDELEFAERNSISILYYQDDNYPTLLKEINDAPIVLFQKGNFDWKSYLHYVGMVGTRKATAYGKTQCERLVEGLSDLLNNPVIVSGLALGVDACSHQMALQQGLPTIGVMASGFRHIYPSQHKTLYRKILDAGGALLTEAFSFEKPEKHNFVKRNRIIAGLSQAIVVVESGAKGGSLITASYAMDYDRDVFAFPGCLHMSSYAGCHRLIKQNIASLLESADDLVQVMNWSQQAKVKQLELSLPLDLTDEENLVLNALKNGRKNIDELSKETNIEFSQLALILLNLEMKKLINNLPGNFYEIK